MTSFPSSRPSRRPITDAETPTADPTPGPTFLSTLTTVGDGLDHYYVNGVEVEHHEGVISLTLFYILILIASMSGVGLLVCCNHTYMGFGMGRRVVNAKIVPNNPQFDV
jgi:hypothetical protein